MDEFIRQLSSGGSLGGGFGVWETLVVIGLAFALNLILAYVYRQSHRGLSYSVSFVHAMVIMGVTVSLIMLIIGSNIARAFALVGALSIIRFRNAVKDSRDVAFIFVAMAIGMAVGTGFYLSGTLFTLAMAAIIYSLSRFEIGAATSKEVLLKVHVPSDQDYHTLFSDVFLRDLRESSLLSVETLHDRDVVELVYSVEFRRGVAERDFLEALRPLVRGNKVALLVGQESVNV